MVRKVTLLASLAVLLATSVLFSECGGRSPTATSVTEDTTVIEQIVADEVVFPNSDLQQKIRRAINKSSGPITESDLGVLTSLNINRMDLNDLTGLDKCTNLTTLILGNCNITDISQLSLLINLTTLSLQMNNLVDISALSSLTKLTLLDVGTNQISNISVLASFTNLNELYLAGNQVVDISPLSSLINLSWLDLRVNKITDISPLLANSGLSQGDTLYLNFNPLSADALNVQIPELRQRGVTIIIK